MGAIDPSFNSDGSFNEELGNLRARLQEHLQRMQSGIRCDHKDRVTGDHLGGLVYQHTDIACADVNTGASATGTYVIPNFQSCIKRGERAATVDQACVQALPGQATIAAITDDYYRQIRRNMPIFQAQSMINVLYRYSHPGPEFTESLGQISSEFLPDLCLDVQWGNPAAGTPVWLWDCLMNDAQWWSYDRETGAIINPAFGKCLAVKPVNDIQPENYFREAAIQTDYCRAPVPSSQKWTYDPESGVLESALGTVLDIQWGTFQAGNPVQTWDRDGFWTEIWYTD
jgi:hypothetical protein